MSAYRGRKLAEVNSPQHLDPQRPELAAQLDLAPHPEGGWFRETWRSSQSFRPDGYDGTRSAATAIYFLLNPGERSRWHVVRSDELWLWHSGGPLILRLGGSGDTPASDPEEVLLGADVAAGQRPQVVIPGGVWQAAAPAADRPVLVSCVVAPGFDFADFRMA
ncbi:cupin domain-containing protein [Micromonospora sp. NPDC049559]|uniref:cupin domain-containing protein n=1 Tax=Micromonospora sp. NPDC049559 TaxID=3155923 RepID=UPI0034275EE6